MGKRRKSLAFGTVGAVGGLVGLSATAGLCAGGACSACFRCAGMGLILVALALWNKMKGEKSDGLAQSSN